MRKKISILAVLIPVLFNSCEEVVNIKLDTQSPKLVVDAALVWIKGTDGKNQTIKLSSTTGYYQQEIPKVTQATVYMVNSANVRFDFLEELDLNKPTGRYTCTNFIPVIGETYTLTILYKGETYEGIETLIPVNKIEDIEQRDDLGINRDEYGIKVNFKDPFNQKNYYLFSFETANRKFPDYEVFDDQFFEGNLGFGVFSDAKSKVGDHIKIKLRGVSQRYFNYMKILIGTADGGQDGPFGPIPSSNIRGNMINKTVNANYCLGYFSLSEADELNYILK
ncbi:DUF4249 domain-containing protein [Pedobacter glucosidilyticus]|uniref:DUF4249 domain-containing protein n=1 Tax=Pedobacter glucosidilyticus TaxID=1122941 RepID=UPI0004264483|nr:DUF4249 domain-containing protein [Pedobacter glucosidilyticus]